MNSILIITSLLIIFSIF
ncbi:hypothetical protein ACUZ0E_004989, partial [Escherichia coli]